MDEERQQRKREMDEQREEWIVTFEETLMRSINLAGSSPKPSIYRVTSSLAEHKKESYTPNTISLGPYHRDKRLDKEKDRALHSFLSQAQWVSFRSLAEAVARVEEELKGHYEMLDDQWGKPNQFLEMMITDGFFVLAVLCFLYFKNNPSWDLCWLVDMESPLFKTRPLDIIEEMGLKFGQQWGSNFMAEIRRDMLLLENQLPILLLQTLMTAMGGEAEHVTMLILNFLGLEAEPLAEVDVADIGLHILDVYWRRKVFENNSSQKIQSMYRSATDLDMAGVQFRKNSSNHLGDISFSCRTLLLPHIDIDDTTKIFLLNLMAFEQLQHAGTSVGVTYYVSFMRGLIHSSKDVALLRNNDIIKPHELSDDDVTKLFKQISKGIFIGLDPYADEKLNCYLKSWWRIQRVKLMRTYFFILQGASPAWVPDFLKTHWVVLALFVGFFYFATYVLQITSLLPHKSNKQ